MDSALHENESVFAVLVLPVLLHVLSDVDCLFNQVVQILGNLGGKAVLLQNSEDLAASDALHLGDTVVVSEHHTDLGRALTLLSHLDDLVDEVIGADLNPGGRSPSVRQAPASDSLSACIHSTHLSLFNN